MTVLTISQDTLIQLPDGATGGAVKISYNGTTVGPVIASGDDQGRAVIVQGRLAKLTALDGKSPMTLVGREAGGRLPSWVTLYIYPEYPAGAAPAHMLTPLKLTGLPVGSPDAPGIWDLSNIGDASGGMDVVLPSERQALAVLRERTAQAAGRAEGAAQTAEEAGAAANDAIVIMTTRIEESVSKANEEWAGIKADTGYITASAAAWEAELLLYREQAAQLAGTDALTQIKAFNLSTYGVHSEQIDGGANYLVTTTETAPLEIYLLDDGTAEIRGDLNLFSAEAQPDQNIALYQVGG